MSDRSYTAIREVDAWLRRMAVIGPMVAFVLGWGSGVLTAAVMYRDHEKRIQLLENFEKEQGITHASIAELLGRITERLHMK
jgi:hypothetical protein